jgi:SPOR domain
MRVSEIAQRAGAATGGEVDPLAELARLIQQDEAFGAIVRRGRSDARAELSLTGHEAPSAHFAEDDDPYQHDTDGDAGAPLIPSFLCDGPIGDSHDPQEVGAHASPDYSNGLPNRRRRLPLFAALVGLALVGSASAMAYWAWFDGRARSADAPVIGASLGPDKTMPTPQGESRAEVRLRGQSDEPSVNAPAQPTTGEEKPADAVPAPPALRPTGVLYGPAPAKVAALTPGAAPPGSPAGPVQTEPADVKEPPPGETAPGAAEPGAPQGPRYVVQLSSQRSEAAAQATSRLLQTKYPDAFGARPPFIRRSDLGDRGVYYRVLTGPFAIEEAKQICGDLKKSGADCVVQKN